MSNLKVHSLRLKPKQEVKTALEKYVLENVPNGCHVMSCCGSVTKATLRMATNKNGETNKIVSLDNHNEVVSMTGTLSQDGTHLHVCLSDNSCHCVGGHVIGDMNVFTTMEVLLGEPLDHRLNRKMDPNTAFDELVVNTI